jgi:hypothetical protein
MFKGKLVLNHAYKLVGGYRLPNLVLLVTWFSHLNLLSELYELAVGEISIESANTLPSLG